MKEAAGCVATFKKQQESDGLGRPGSVSCNHLEQLVDALNLSPNIRTAHPPRFRIGAVLVTELSRWGRSTQDLLDTLYQLAGWKVSVAAMNGMTFELNTPHGRMMATMLAGITQFERALLSERVKSGLAAARARGKKRGRQPGQRPKSDRLAPKVLHAIDGGKSYRWIPRGPGISKNTVADIVKRHRANP